MTVITSAGTAAAGSREHFVRERGVAPQAYRRTFRTASPTTAGCTTAGCTTAGCTAAGCTAAGR
jgi:hypothetical protein